MSQMPDEIWAGYLGGSRMWGPVTPETHPDNTRYVRADRAALSDEEIETLSNTIVGFCTKYHVEFARAIEKRCGVAVVDLVAAQKPMDPDFARVLNEKSFELAVRSDKKPLPGNAQLERDLQTISGYIGVLTNSDGIKTAFDALDRIRSRLALDVSALQRLVVELDAEQTEITKQALGAEVKTITQTRNAPLIEACRKAVKS